MTWQPAYCTNSELKSYLRITDAQDDTELGFAIEGASRAIDQACNRQFGVTASEARVYTFSDRRGRLYRDPLALHQYISDPWRTQDSLEVDDISSASGLLVKLDADDDGVFETTITGYRLWPYNSVAKGRPFERLVLNAGNTFPLGVAGVQITATFGWAAVPVAVKEACLIQASRFFMRRNAPFGVAGSPDMGSELRLLARIDPDVSVLLTPYKRVWGWA